MFITGFLQMVQDLPPLQAGLWMVPSALASIIAAMAAPALVRRLPTGVVIGVGLGVTAAGYLLIALVDPAGGLPLLIAGFVIAFLGTGPIGALGTALVVGSAPPQKAGSAAAMSETSGELGVSFGIAALGSLGAAIYRGDVTVPDAVPADDAEAIRNSIEGALVTAPHLPAELGNQVLTAARDAYTSGLNTIGIVCAVLVAGTAALAATSLRNTTTAKQPPSAPAGTTEKNSTEAATSARLTRT